MQEIDESGGLNGHKVTLKVLNDNSDPATVATNYTQLISGDHAAFVFGPFSTLADGLGCPGGRRGSHYALHRGRRWWATGVLAEACRNLFAVSPVVADQLIPFAQWVAALPANERPKTAAYPMVTDPFAVPHGAERAEDPAECRHQDGVLQDLPSGRTPPIRRAPTRWPR